MSTKQITCDLPKLMVLNDKEKKAVTEMVQKLKLGLHIEEVAELPSRHYCIFYLTKDEEYTKLKKLAVSNRNMAG